MAVRGVRGAIDVSTDEPQAILAATRTLLRAIREANPKMMLEDLASALFTTTPDLHSVPPALAARELGWTQVPLLCLQEMSVEGGAPRLIRILLHWNTHLPQRAVRHVYLGRASDLRPDLGLEPLSATDVIKKSGWMDSLRQSLQGRSLRPIPMNCTGEPHDGSDEIRR